MDFLDMLKDRGLVAQVTHEQDLKNHLNEKPRTVYAGFDPTAKSLHVGHLMPLMALQRFQMAGHRVIAICGGGTALVGDPTGKTELRSMLTKDQIHENLQGIKKQIGSFIDLSSPSRGLVLNNLDWLEGLNYLEFLRDIGPHFSVNRMLTADCFRQRMEKGLSFIEFNYMLLQSYDFLHLFQSHACTLQIGGDDQWSNILSGMELIRRLTQNGQAYCLTTPLLTTSSGQKMGKTEKGAVWLDPEWTSPFDYFQYWRNVEDLKVQACLAYFTHLPMSEVLELTGGFDEKGFAIDPKKINGAKVRLAFEATKILHGESAALDAQKSAQGLFGGQQSGQYSGPKLAMKREELAKGMDVLELLRLVGFAPSRGEARRLITQGGVMINGQSIQDPSYKISQSDFQNKGEGEEVLVQKGKKAFIKVILTN